MKHFYSLLILLLLAAGCGGNMKVGGTVTFTDGTPLECGTITFTNGIIQARGEIGAGGKYTLGTLTGKDGIAPGEYTVYITGAESVAPSPKDKELHIYIPLVAPQFTSPERSPLKITINKRRDYDVQVEKAAGKDAQADERP